MAVKNIIGVTSGSVLNKVCGVAEENIYSLSSSYAYTNHCIEFDGTDDYITFGDLDGTDWHWASTNGLADGKTVSAWINTDVINANEGIFSNDGIGDTTSSGVWVQLNSAGKPMLQYGNGSSTGASSRKARLGSAALSASTWYHIVYVFVDNDRANWKIYVNASAQTLGDSGTYSGSVGYEAGTAPGGIGAKQQHYFNGKMCHIAIWNTALDANTVTSLYNSGKPNNLAAAASYTNNSGTDKSGNLFHWMRFDEGTGTATDQETDDEDVTAGAFVSSPGWVNTGPA